MSKQMILRHSGPSPFCRKVDIAAKHHDLSDQIVDEGVNMLDDNETLRLQNPLGKIPALNLPDGRTIYDSDVIVEYFETIGSGAALIPNDESRIDCLVRYALASGITEAALAVVYEKRMRPEDKVFQGSIDYQMGKISRGLDRVAADLPNVEALDVANITTACMLEYMDLRINEDMRNGTELNENKGQWRTSHPALVQWLAEFEQLCPYFSETRPY